MNNIQVFDHHSIEMNKYPRNDLKYRINDIVLITFFMNIEQLKKIIALYEEVYKHYNECKEYYFYFEFLFESNEKIKKTYSAKEIINLIKNIDFIISTERNNENLKKYFKRLPILDIILYFYLKNRLYFNELFQDLEKAKNAYFQGKNYSIKFYLPNDFYSYKQSNHYDALELFEIYTYSQFLLKNKIKKNLPLPKYLSD
jgi:hypothetical protein